jgi:2,5-diamino-6-(ribosylamino)-4(3H)-pyrimidinone 5'-phosphate reductase
MLPRVILHNEVSLDGRFDWIAPDLGQFYELASCWNEDATLAGSETMLGGYPEEQLSAEDAETAGMAEKDPDDRRPLLVIPDSRGRLRCWHLLRREPYWRDVVALCSRSTPGSYLAHLDRIRVDCIVAGDDRVDLRAALEELNARHGVSVVRVDAGGTLNGALLRAGLVDEVSLLIDPCLVGGTTPRSVFQVPDLTSSEGVVELRLVQLEKVRGDVVWVRYEVVK